MWTTGKIKLITNSQTGKLGQTPVELDYNFRKIEFRLPSQQQGRAGDSGNLRKIWGSTCQDSWVANTNGIWTHSEHYLVIQPV